MRCGQPTPREQVTVAHQSGEGGPSPLGAQAVVRPVETTQVPPPPPAVRSRHTAAAVGEPLELSEEHRVAVAAE